MKQLFIKKVSITLLLFLTPFVLISQTQIGSDIDGEAAGDQSGVLVSVSSDGTIIAIGARLNDGNGNASGHVRVYRNNNGVWEQIGNDINGEGIGDESGRSVSLSSDGSIIAIGARYNDGNGDASGHVRVYRNNNGVWVQVGGDINGKVIGDLSGHSVSLSSDGSIVAIGAYNSDINGEKSGLARVYRNNNGSWEQVGVDIKGEAAGDRSGWSVSLSSNGSIVAIGAYLNDGNGGGSGHARVYQNNNGTWEQIGSDIDGENGGDSSGESVSLSSDGSILAIGAQGNNGNGNNSGHVRVFQNTNGSWVQVGSDIDGKLAGDNFGNSVSLSSNGSVLAIGAHFNSNGYAQVYQNINGVWIKKGNDMNGEGLSDYFGGSVSLSSDGKVVVIGGGLNDENGIDSGHVRVYNLSTVLKTTDFLLSKFSVFPNPVTNSFTIQLKENIQLKKVSIYNSLGQFIKSSKILTTNTSNLTKGIYVLKIETDKGTASKKLVIE
jgi:hypothetical protein